MNSSTIVDLNKDNSLLEHNYRLIFDENEQPADTCKSLSKLHNRNVLPCKFLKRINLTKKMDRKTLSVSLGCYGFNKKFLYKPGDHIGIFAENRKDLIDRILLRLKEVSDFDKTVKIEAFNSEIINLFK